MVARTGLFVAPLPGGTPAGTSPTDGRLVLGSLYGVGAGCLTGGGLTASATAMQLTVAQAVWRIPDPTNAAGVYLSPADPVTLTFSAGPATGSRIDVAWVRQNNFEAADADSRVTYGVAAGVAASTPVAPSIPAGAIKVATVTVPTGASNLAACTVVAGYPQQVAPPNVIAATVPQLPAAGQFLNQRASVGSTEYRWNGTSWQPWLSPWISYTPTLQNVTLGSGGTTNMLWRWSNGLVHVRGEVVQGTGPSITGNVSMTLPTNSIENFRPIGDLWVVAPSGGGVYHGFTQAGAPGTNVASLFVYRADGTYLREASLASGQPIAATASTVWRFNLMYDSFDNPLGTS